MSKFSEDEVAALRVLDALYQGVPTQVGLDEVAAKLRRDPFDLLPVLQSLQRENLVRSVTLQDETWKILPAVRYVVEQLDQPEPLPDHWDDRVRWFRSKRWSVPLIAAVIAVPFLVGCFTLFQGIRRLLGFVD